jgi:hypothetical protein
MRRSCSNCCGRSAAAKHLICREGDPHLATFGDAAKCDSVFPIRRITESIPCDVECSVHTERCQSFLTAGMSHNRTVPSSLPDASSVPSLLNATEWTIPV